MPRQLPSLYQCNSCQFISNTSTCPRCGKTIPKTRIYPDEKIRELLNMIRYFRAKSIERKSDTANTVLEEEKTIVILAYSVIEGLFYHLLEGLLRLDAKNREQANEILKIHRSLKKRKKLFLELSGVSLRQAIQEIEQGFYDRWMELNRQRNRFLHDTPQAINSEVVRIALALTDKCVPLFREMSNQLIQK